MPELKDLQHDYSSLMTKVEDKRDSIQKATADETQELLNEIDSMLNDAEKQRSVIESITKIESRNTALRSWEQELGPNPLLTGDPKGPNSAESQRAQNWNHYLSGGSARGLQTFHDDATQRAVIQVDSDIGGAFVIIPTEVMGPFLQAIDDEVQIRALATKYTVGVGQSFGMPGMGKDVNDPEWTGELTAATFSEDQELNKREMRPHRLVKGIKISNDSLRAPGMDVASFWNTRMAVKFGEAQENAFLSGDGVDKPLGLLSTAGKNSIPITQDVTTAAGAKIAADDLIDTFYSLKSYFSQRAVWFMHRFRVRDIRKIKDADGQYLWQPSIQAGEPDLLLGRPLYHSEFMPIDTTSGKYFSIFGDFTNYVIIDSLSMEVQRLIELFALTNETGFIARQYLDGQPIRNEAFARLKFK